MADGGTVAVTLARPRERDLHALPVADLDASPGSREPRVPGDRPAGGASGPETLERV